MRDYLDFYIGGEWVKPADGARTLDVDQSRPTRASPAGSASAAPRMSTARSPPPRPPSRLIRRPPASSGSSCSRRSPPNIRSATPRSPRRSPRRWARRRRSPSAPRRRSASATSRPRSAVLKDYAFEEQRGATLIKKEPIGVCGFITPWNWPINQIATKVFPALATGCTMVLKPSEIAPFSGYIFAQVLDAAGVPAGRVQPGQRRRARASAPPSPPIPTSTWSPSPARPAPASPSPRPRPTRSSGSIRSWAASRPSSSSRMPTSARR